MQRKKATKKVSEMSFDNKPGAATLKKQIAIILPTEDVESSVEQEKKSMKSESSFKSKKVNTQEEEKKLMESILEEMHDL